MSLFITDQNKFPKQGCNGKIPPHSVIPVEDSPTSPALPSNDTGHKRKRSPSLSEKPQRKPRQTKTELGYDSSIPNSYTGVFELNQGENKSQPKLNQYIPIDTKGKIKENMHVINNLQTQNLLLQEVDALKKVILQKNGIINDQSLKIGVQTRIILHQKNVIQSRERGIQTIIGAVRSLQQPQITLPGRQLPPPIPNPANPTSVNPSAGMPGIQPRRT